MTVPLKHIAGPAATTFCGDLLVEKGASGLVLAEGCPEGHSVAPTESAKPLVDQAARALESHRRRPDGSYLRPHERPLPAEFVAAVGSAGFCVRCVAAAGAQKTWAEEPPRMTEDELHDFVFGFVEGRLFTSAHIKHGETLLQSIFMTLLFLDPSPPPDYLDKVGIVWEWISKAGPRSVNGYPMFTSFSFMHADDWSRALAAAKRLEAQRKDFAV